MMTVEVLIIRGTTKQCVRHLNISSPIHKLGMTLMLRIWCLVLYLDLVCSLKLYSVFRDWFQSFPQNRDSWIPCVLTTIQCTCWIVPGFRRSFSIGDISNTIIRSVDFFQDRRLFKITISSNCISMFRLKKLPGDVYFVMNVTLTVPLQFSKYNQG